MSKLKVDLILTVDRSMMTNHHGKEFLGFMTTGPALYLPESMWKWISMPKMKVDEFGRPWQAPYGLRKVEATLQNAGFNAHVIDPDYIDRYIDNAKAVMIGHHDYFALGPPSSEWWLLTNKEPVNRRSFISFMESPPMKKAKKLGLKIVMGGPAAWQWLWSIDFWKKWGVDTVIDGEAEKVIDEIAEKIMNDEPLPRYVYVGAKETPKLKEIPIIKHASVNGLIEIMRGCPRGCKFCPVTLRPLRYYTLDMIEKEIKVNLREGVTNGILHSEDVLLYGADGVLPRPEPLIKLHKLAKKYLKVVGWSHASLAAIVYAEKKYHLISDIADILLDENQKYWGVEVGIETGSPRLAKIIMPAKAAPYSIEKWPDIVEEAFAIMNDHNIIPAATLIIGLPEEKTEDLIKTAELIERLKPYKSLIVTMFFVPMGALKNKKWFETVEVKDEHLEVMTRCLEHDLYWVSKLIDEYFESPLYFPIKEAVRFFIKVAKRNYEKWKREHIEAVMKEAVATVKSKKRGIKSLLKELRL